MSDEINLSLLARTAVEQGAKPLLFNSAVAQGTSNVIYRALDDIRDIAQEDVSLLPKNLSRLSAAIQIVTESGVQFPPEVAEIFRAAQGSLAQIIQTPVGGGLAHPVERTPAVALAGSASFRTRQDMMGDVVQALDFQGATRDDVQRITGVAKRELIPDRSMDSLFVNTDSSRLYFLEIHGGVVYLTRYLSHFEPIDRTSFETDIVERVGAIGISRVLYVQRANGQGETVEALWDSEIGEWSIAGEREASPSYNQTLDRLKTLALEQDVVGLQSCIDSLPEALLWRIYAEEVYDWVMDISFARTLTEAHIEGASRHLEATEGRRVLDIGAGTGLVAKGLSDRGYALVVVEPNHSMAERMKKRLSGVSNVRLHKAFFENVDLGDESFDLINMRNVLYLIEDQEAFMRKVFSHLKPGGNILVSGPMPNAREILPLLARDTLRELAATGRREDMWRFFLVGPLNARLLKGPYIRRVSEVADLLREVGLEVETVNNSYYANSTYLIEAVRPGRLSGKAEEKNDAESATLRGVVETFSHNEENPAGTEEVDDRAQEEVRDEASEEQIGDEELKNNKASFLPRRLNRFPGEMTGFKTGVAGRTFMTRNGNALFRLI